MISVKGRSTASYAEFVVILSLMMSLTALSIDAMLPALPHIANELGATTPNSRQLVISLIFLGQGVGQLFFGPLSDATGRKPAMYVGYSVFIIGSLLSGFSASFSMMLWGRALQGVGIAAPRAISMALVRDRFAGREMARVMSFVMTVFVLVPIIAPSIGQGILLIADWRAIFVSFVWVALFTMIWFALRMPETLAVENRKSFSPKQVVHSIWEIVKIRTALGYTVAAGLVFGTFIGYLNSSQQIFQEQYGLGELFPVVFAVISISLGLASFLNARLVMRYGMRILVQVALTILCVLAVVFLGVTALFTGHPPLWLLMAYLMVSFFCIGILFGNINAMAMQPLGHLAGIGAAVVGSLSTLISAWLGMMIGQNYNGTLFPLVLGIAVLAAISLLVVRWTEP